MGERVELLAPAGSFEGLVGVIRAGADAVYLGGERFSARAYAANFGTEDLVKGIGLAHLFGRKVYLALNTLVKEREFGEVYEFLCPLYERGLDGVIVQDFGLLRYIKDEFPGLIVHASTQMNVTDGLGARFLSACGVKRIVLAREPGLEEIRKIHSEVGVELEVFVHGAMCYSYSGRCLFSSALGERSGNRGRCAQPCRLPYRREGNDKGAADWYPLSMRDMCTLRILPELIESGVSSFKIEGRMKKPEYAAGVTAVYRKYIDLYYDECGKKSEYGYKVADSDREMLKSLYLRSDVSEGYYYRKKGVAMITEGKPSYDSSDESLLKRIRDEYIEGKLTKAVNGIISLNSGEKAVLELDCDRVYVGTEGVVVEEAKNQPLLTETVNKQLRKSGDSNFHFNKLQINMRGDVFVPIKELNELRRESLKNLEALILSDYMRVAPERKGVIREFRMSENSGYNQEGVRNELCLSVSSLEQWEALCECFTSGRIYINADLWKEIGDFKPAGQEWFLVLPPVFRRQDEGIWEEYEGILKRPECDGVLIGNIESFEWLRCIAFKKAIVGDHSIYIWNREAAAFWQDKGLREFYLPLELNMYELREILCDDITAGLMVYGRFPMMYSANCLRYNSGGLCGTSGFSSLYDRFNKQFPVYHNCRECYNVVYNSVPLSLHALLRDRGLPGVRRFRLDFTTESGEETRKVIRYYRGLTDGKKVSLPYKDFTAGHIKRTVS